VIFNMSGGGSTVSYKFYFEITGDPGAAVTATGPDELSGTIGSDGNLTLTATVPGTYTISATLDDQASLPVTLVAADDGTTYQADCSFLVEHASLEEYSATELRRIADDLAAKGASSTKYEEFHGYLTNGATWKTSLVGLDSFASENQILEARIIGINHDTATEGGTAGLTFQAIHALPYAFQTNESDTTSGGWESSKMRTTLNSGEVWQMLPTDLQSNLVSVQKITNNVSGNSNSSDVSETSDKVFLLSYAEYVAKSYWSGTIANEGEQYEYWNGKVTNNYSGNSALIPLTTCRDGSAYASHEGSLFAGPSWERSPDPTNAANFCRVNSLGDPSHSNNASYGMGVTPGFSF
jgi:hypothetical protein